VVARGLGPIVVSSSFIVESSLLTSIFVEVALLPSAGPSNVAVVKGGKFRLNPGIALQAAAALLETKVPRTRGGCRRSIDTLKWRCESFEQEVVEIMSERAMCLSTIEDLEAVLAAMSSSEAEDLDRGDEEDEIESDE
jgi:hypothetical protein